MTPADFGAWAFTVIFSVLFAAAVVAVIIGGAVLGIGAIVEWFDKRAAKRKGNHR